MGVLVSVTNWVANTFATSARMQTLSDGIRQLRGEATISTGTPLDYCIMTRTTQSIANATTTAIAFNAEVIDAAGGHSTVTNNSRYVGQHAGYYRVEASAEFAANTTGDRSVRIHVNGTLVAAALHQGRAAAGGAVSTVFSVAQDVFLDGVDDFIEITVTQTSGANLDVSNARATVQWVHV